MTFRPHSMRSSRPPARRPRHAILKGRTNYVCMLRLREGAAQDQGVLITAGDLIDNLRSSPQSTPESALGAEVLALREWAENQFERDGLADRDDAPSTYRTRLGTGLSAGPGMLGCTALPLRC